MANEKTTEFVITSGSHFQDGKQLKVGDKIKLTEKQAKFMAGKIADPTAPTQATNNTPAADPDKELVAKVEKLELRVLELEAENENLQNQVAELEEEDLDNE